MDDGAGDLEECCMTEMERILKEIEKTRAEQAAQMKTGVPTGVQLGPLTSTIRNGARWATQDQFPSDQIWADEVERVLTFAQAQGQFDHYLNKLRGNARQRNSALDELRAAFFVSSKGFPVVEWEPIGADNKEGEYTIRTPSGIDVFTEVKSPSWEGELSDEERASGRKQQPKYMHSEVRAIGPWKSIRFAVDKAYGKYLDTTPNLLVIADDLFVSLRHGTELHVGTALYDPRDGGYFTNASRENLGGVGVFWVTHDGSEILYTMKLFLNPHALPAVAIPEELAIAVNAVDQVDRW
jgi:hypothetical protein